jgi:hypothetical protein
MLNASDLVFPNAAMGSSTERDEQPKGLSLDEYSKKGELSEAAGCPASPLYISPAPSIKRCPADAGTA